MTLKESLRRKSAVRRTCARALAVVATVGLFVSASPDRLQPKAGFDSPGISCPVMHVPAEPSVDFYVDVLAGDDRKTAVVDAIERSGPYMAFIQDVLCQHGLPRALAYLVIIESESDILAESTAGAKGLWQFRQATARSLGMRVDGLVDERGDPELSTYGAAVYLRYLYGKFGSWEMALAAYNAGETRVRDSIRTAGTDDFWALRRQKALPVQTREYVPKFYAAMQLAKNPARYGLGPINHEPGVALKAIHIYPWTDPHSLAASLGVDVDQLREWNPHLTDSFFSRGPSSFGGGARFGSPDILRLKVPADQVRRAADFVS